MKITVNVIQSFSLDGAGGNPAGVVLNANQLNTAQKQAVASEAGLSETAFVSDSAVADFKLEFFTPTKQIPHCGHATIATFWYLRSLGKVSSVNSSKETIEDVRKILFVGDEPYMEQPGATFSPIATVNDVLNSLGLTTAHIDSRFQPVVGNTGNSFVLIGIREELLLQELKPDFDKIKHITEDLGCIGYYVFATSRSGVVAETRMFAPAYGINEESATGMAAGPLACLLYNSGVTTLNTLTIGQGRYMTPASPSRINVELMVEGPKVVSLMAGGAAYLAETRLVEV
jgi:PhzF family phenazine biosynthesis protein